MTCSIRPLYWRVSIVPGKRSVLGRALVAIVTVRSAASAASLGWAVSQEIGVDVGRIDRFHAVHNDEFRRRVDESKVPEHPGQQI